MQKAILLQKLIIFADNIIVTLMAKIYRVGTKLRDMTVNVVIVDQKGGLKPAHVVCTM